MIAAMPTLAATLKYCHSRSESDFATGKGGDPIVMASASIGEILAARQGQSIGP